MISIPKTTTELDELISEPTPGVIEAVRQCSGRFAVLGAGGKMGYHFSLMLQKSLRAIGRSDSVIVVSRFGSAETKGQFESDGFEVVPADLSEQADVASLPDCENVFFLAGIKFGTSGNSELLQRMNVHMPRLVCERFRNSRFVALSTGCVYSFTAPQSGGSNEQSATDPPGEYAQSCKGREAAFFDAAERFGTKSSLIRLNYSIDLRYGVLVDVAQKVLAGLPVNVETGYANVIWQGDAVAHAIQALPYASSPPFVLNVTGPEVVRIRSIASAFADRFGCDVFFDGDEQPTAWLNDASGSHKMFGQPKVGLEQMIDSVAEWLQAGGEVLGKPTHFETRGGDY